MKTSITPPRFLHMPPQKNLSALTITMLGLLAAFPVSSQAVNNTWNDGGPSDVWDLSAANWISPATWTNGDQAVFAGAGETISVEAAISTAGTATSITFSGLGGGYTLAAGPGGSLALQGTVAISAANTSGINSIAADISLTRGGSSAQTFSVATGGTLAISGDISQTGTGALLLSGQGTVILSGSNTLTGQVQLNSTSNKLTINSANALGNGALTFGSNSGSINNTSGGVTVANGINVTTATPGSGAANNITMTGSNNITFNGVTALNTTIGNLSRAISVTGSGTLTLAGGVSESASFVGTSLIKNGAGALAMGGVISYTGATTVSAGTLLINGNATSATGAVTVSNANTTLGGIGTVGGATTMNTLTILSAGDGSAGTLAFDSNLSLAGGAGAAGTTAIFEGGDLVTVAGTLTLADNWNLTLTTGFQDGGSMTLFTYGTAGGTLDLTPDIDISGLGFTPTGSLTLTDTGSSIVLNGISVVPEPAGVALVGLGLMVTLFNVRRRRLV